MEKAVVSSDLSPTPYFDWISSHMELPMYSIDYPYEFGEQVILEGHLYESLIDNNLGINPYNSIYWKQLI